MIVAHRSDDFYLCDDCSEMVDTKGSPHVCEGSRDDALVMLGKAREEIANLRAALDAARSIVGTAPITALTRAPTVAQMQALQEALRKTGVL